MLGDLLPALGSAVSALAFLGLLPWRSLESPVPKSGFPAGQELLFRELRFLRQRSDSTPRERALQEPLASGAARAARLEVRYGTSMPRDERLAFGKENFKARRRVSLQQRCLGLRLFGLKLLGPGSFHPDFCGFKAVRARAVRVWNFANRARRSAVSSIPASGQKRPLHVPAQRLRCVDPINRRNYEPKSRRPARRALGAAGNADSGTWNLASQLMKSGTNFPVRELRFRDKFAPGPPYQAIRNKIRFELATQNWSLSASVCRASIRCH